MVDELITSPCHIICTMRTKTDYQEQVDSNGKKKRVKIGLAPVQREGLEYEFDLVGYMDEDNTFAVDKTRCPAYSQKAYTKPGPKEFAPFVDWLKGAAREPKARPTTPPAPATPPYHTGGHAAGTAAAAAAVAQQKIEAGNPATSKPWTTFGEMKRIFHGLREKIGEYDFLAEMERYGWKSVNDIRSLEKAVECYHHLQFLADRADEMRKEVA